MVWPVDGRSGGDGPRLLVRRYTLEARLHGRAQRDGTLGVGDFEGRSRGRNGFGFRVVCWGFTLRLGAVRRVLGVAKRLGTNTQVKIEDMTRLNYKHRR